MRVQRSIVLAVGILASSPMSGAQTGQFMVYGPGTASCGVWSEGAFSMARDANTTLVHAARIGWVLGFVSGVGSTGGRLRQTDGIALEKWVDNYCQQNPLDNVSVAAMALVRELTLK